MFAYIDGAVSYVAENCVVLDHNGIGYEILMPSSDLMKLSAGEDIIRIYTYFQVSENGIMLCGFLSRESKELFLMLISVNGVGPKAALAILGTLSSETLRFAIVGEDVKKLSQAPGIGSKTAKRIILDLKDKIDPVLSKDEDISEGGISLSKNPTEKSDAMEALVALGYSSSEVAMAFTKLKLGDEAEAELWIREALKYL